METTGVVVDFEEMTISGDVEYWPVIEFSADGKKQQDDFPMENVEIGDTFKIYYSVHENVRGEKSYRIDGRYLVEYKRYWRPPIVMGILLILFRATFFRLKDHLVQRKEHPKV